MKQSQIIHIVIIVVTVILGSYLASYLQKKQLKIAPSKKLVSKSPMGGFHKFASDVEWMRFINYCGSQKSVDSKNIEEHIRRLEKIISLDPNFEKSYSVGVQMLAIQAPDKAVALLSKACKNEKLKKNWKIPFYAGFILTHHYPDDSRINEAVEFYEQAVRRAGQPEKYLVNALLRTKAKAEYQKNKDKYANMDHVMLNTLYKEWKKSRTEMDSMGAGSAGGGGLGQTIPDLTDRMLEIVQKVKKNTKDNPQVTELITQVRKDVLASKHLCNKCLTPYGPGDKFCSKCGNQVTVFGICPKCSHILKGEFCSNCGFDTSK